MILNPLQFAVVREDPQIEAALVASKQAKHILLIGSGGCTALSLQALYPDLQITLVDPNAAQISHVRRKIQALQSLSGAQRKQTFNIEDSDPHGLNARGNFESLFRGLKNWTHEMVCPPADLANIFASPTPAKWKALFKNKYWPVGFEMFFSDSILNAMFGPDATQHAPPGSYPDYFRGVIEKGLLRSDCSTNYFLHHIFLGYYLDRPEALPPYLTLTAPKNYAFEWLNTDILGVRNFADYDLVSLSNIFDWMPEKSVAKIARRLTQEMKPGATLVFRQLNHSKNFKKYLLSRFNFKKSVETSLWKKDRSFFYSKLNIGTHR